MAINRVWECPAGTFVGYEDRGCVQVTGIRYATSERYGTPVPYAYGPTVHDCTMPAPFAPQLASTIEGFLSGVAYETYLQEESCQYLSVTMPGDVRPGDNLPVMVWIHGGAFRNGGCDSPSYDRVPLVSENGVVVVGINYRLALLGFVRDQEGDFTNNGLLDVIEGLRWVQANISSFGGDPANVTIFGQSAGAECVRCVMLAEGTDSLYARAIMQSDPIGTMENREAMEQKILEELNAVPIDATIDELLEAQRRITANVTEKGNARHMIFGPHFGVYPLPDQQDIPARLREVAPTHELVIGSATREVSAYLASIAPIVALYGFPPTRWIVEKVVSNMSRAIFNEPSDEFARQYAAAGGKVWRYVFSWGEGRSIVGACHTMDFPPLFGLQDCEGKPIAMGLSAKEIYEQGVPMRRIWAGFARAGRVSETSVEGMLEISDWTA